MQLDQGEGDPIRSRVIGVYYYDAESGKSALLSAVSDSTAWLRNSNEVIYPAAFKNVDADLVYKATAGAFEQDVVFSQSSPPDPAAIGMNPYRTYLQVVTEFIGTQPSVQARAGTATSDLKDEDIQFGALRLDQGRAFSMNADYPSVAVRQQWERVGGRSLLIEAASYADLQKAFAKLPPRTTPFTPASMPSRERYLPGAPASTAKDILVAATPPSFSQNAVVLDYILVPTSGAPNPFTFQSGQTYFVSTGVSLQNVIFQNGAVIKFARGASLSVNGTVQCPTNVGPRCILTAVDDHTEGETLTANPVAGTYAFTALLINSQSGNPVTLQNLDIRYANKGLTVNVPGGVFMAKVTLVRCNIGIDSYFTGVDMLTTSQGTNIFCDVTQPYHDSGSAEFYGGPPLFLTGTQDNDQDLLANIDELTRRKSNPMNAFSFISTNRKDGEFLLLGGDGGFDTNTRLQIVPPIQFNGTHTLVRLRISNTPVDYLWDIFFAPQLNPNAYGLIRTGEPNLGWGTTVHFYDVVIPGAPPQGFFEAFVAEDLDYDGVQDGYEIAVLKTATGNPDSASTRDANNDGQPDFPNRGNNGIADGDEDFDQDGMTTTFEIRLGIDAVVAQPPTDSDGDGLPNWLEGRITFLTGDPAPTGTGDSDGDGRNNFSEWSSQLNPADEFDAELDVDFANLPDDQRVIRHQAFEMGRAGTIGQEGYTDTSLIHIGTVGHLHIHQDTDANGNSAPGVDTWRWGAGYIIPTEAVAFGDIPNPDPADGLLDWNEILNQATGTAGNIWKEAQVSAKLNTLRQPSLVYLQHRSFHRITMHYRQLQLMVVAQQLPQGTLLRVKPVLASIHTEATILRHTTLQIATRFPALDAFARIGRFVPVIGGMASVLSAYSSAQENVVPAWNQYLFDIWRRCDDSADSALFLAVGLGAVLDNAFPGILITNAWGHWYDRLSKFDGWSSACF